MKALTFKHTGSLDVLQLTEWPIPTPGAGELLVRLTSVGLNRGDALFREGRYFFKPDFSNDSASRIGFEGAGVVEACGPHTRLQPGDRVAVLITDQDVVLNGCLAEYGIYREEKLLRTPAGISNELAGSLWMAYLTAWGGMVCDGGLKTGETVVVTAASSSVGLAAIQMAKFLGATPIATTTSEEKVDQLKKLGAPHVINVRQDNYEEKVREISHGKGSNLVFDAVAGPGTRDLIKASAVGGRLVIHGRLDPRPMDIHSGVIMKRQLTIKGFVFGQTMQSPALLHQAADLISEGIKQKTLTPIIAGQFPLGEFRQAFELLESNRQIGKIVINPWPN